MRSPTFPCWVRETKALTPSIWSISFNVDKPIEFEAGQYINIVIPSNTSQEEEKTRNYSLCTPPGHSPMEICFETVGEGPGYLTQLREGDIFEARGPFGDFVYRPVKNHHLCFIATGSGVGPFRSMLLSQTFRDHPPVTATCILGTENENEIPYREDLELFGNKERQYFFSVLSDGSLQWKGERGKIAESIKYFSQRLPLLRSISMYLDGVEGYPWQRTEFFLCGDGQMINEVKEVLYEKGVSDNLIHEEVYFEAPPKQFKRTA